MSDSRYTDLGLQPLAGEWRHGRAGRRLKVSNPFDGSLLLEIEQADRDDLDAAYAKAAEVQPAWAALGPSARAAVLYKAVEVFDRRHEEIVDWLIRESGSTRLKAEIEWGAARAITLESASFPARVHGRIVESDVPGKESRVYRSAIGVVGVISPWNFPLHLTQRSIAPALALGNAVVVKPASDTPVCGGLLLARIFEEAGLPAGLFSVVVGPGSEIGDAFVEHPVPGLVTFTGSTPVGRNIGRIASGGAHLKHVALELGGNSPFVVLGDADLEQAVNAAVFGKFLHQGQICMAINRIIIGRIASGGAHLKHVALELGGNSPFVVLGDADLEQAVNAAVFGKFLHQGQICMAINRIIVEDSLYDAFAARFVERVKGLRVGDPQRADTAVGPIVNARQLEGLLEKIRLARQEGAKPLYEGGVDGQLLAPHVFGEVRATMEIARDEIFGPLVGLLRARDEAHALELANASEYGLSSAVFSRDLERAVRFARQLRAGMTHVNDIPVNDEANAPFGGEKNSGLGRFNGDWAIEEFTTDHWISVQHAPRQYPF
ncbi:aldehyde dehydrogenase family protein [Pseudomonas aeruginosa]|uniref:aldehyde dehydrogenase family protein n=23 Tax=Gammaproteobacteria TaxID=1236 RepID=UPI003B280401